MFKILEKYPDDRSLTVDYNTLEVFDPDLADLLIDKPEDVIEAAKLGDELLVLINSDASVRAIKGESRPVVSESDRAYLLAALESVSKVVIFDDARCDKELAALKPDVYAKAGDYTLETLVASEREALQSCGAEIVFMPFIKGFSTTNIIEVISKSLRNS